MIECSVALSFGLLCIIASVQSQTIDEELYTDEAPLTNPSREVVEKMAEIGQKRVIPFSGGVYGKRSLPLQQLSDDEMFKRGQQLPFSGGLYGKRSSSVPFHGGIYGKRGTVALPFSGGVYGKRNQMFPWSDDGLYVKKALTPFQGGFYGKRGSVPFSGGLYGKRSIAELYGQRRLSLRSVPMSGGFFG